MTNVSIKVTESGLGACSKTTTETGRYTGHETTWKKKKSKTENNMDGSCEQ